MQPNDSKESSVLKMEIAKIGCFSSFIELIQTIVSCCHCNIKTIAEEEA